MDRITIMGKEIKFKNLLYKNPARRLSLWRDSSGFVILYVVILSSIILSMALGVSNIALKEIKFSTSAKNTNDAFFAADTGAECALYYDKSSTSVFISSSSPTIICNGSSIIARETPASYWSFDSSGLGNRGEGCAKVTVDKSIPPETSIISKGYDNGGDLPGFCSPQESNSVERQIELNY